MAVQYNKLWKLLIDKKIKPSALSKMTGIAPLYYGEAGQG